MTIPFFFLAITIVLPKLVKKRTKNFKKKAKKKDLQGYKLILRK
jgi:hypothetical protein